jgi:hypothetical protein
MWWLFGQIWLWSLISFTFGAALTALVFTRKRAAPSDDQPLENRLDQDEPRDTEPQDAEPQDTGTRNADEPHARETEPAYASEPPPEWPTEQEELAEEERHRETPPPFASPPRQRTGEPGTTEEPAWPRAEDWMAAERRPEHRP